MDRRKDGVFEYIQRLGLQTYGKERQDPTFIVRRPVFHYKPVAELYKLELNSLFGRLLRDEGSLLDRDDPQLFDKELDALLQEYGPVIWPPMGRGSRSHLLQPKKGTWYPTDLVYPRDSADLKTYLRQLILHKKVRPKVDVDGLINKTHTEAKLIRHKETSGPGPGPHPEPGLVGERSAKESKPLVTQSRSPAAEQFDSAGNVTQGCTKESEDSIMNSQTRRRICNTISHLSAGPFKVGLRLYRSNCKPSSATFAYVSSFGMLLLTEDCDTTEKLFSQVCEKIKTDCHFMVFELPMDMVSADQGQIRVDRDSGDAQITFQQVLTILRQARQFPYGPGYRSIEVEVGPHISLEED